MEFFRDSTVRKISGRRIACEVAFRGLVPPKLVLRRKALERFPGLTCESFRAFDPLAEALRGAAEGQLGIGREAAGNGDAREEHVAELLGAGIVSELPDLLTQLGDRIPVPGEREAHRSRTLLGLRRVGQGGQPEAHLVEDAFPTPLALLTLPQITNPTGALGDRVAVDVGVASDQLAGVVGRDGAEVGVAGLFHELCQEHGLEEQVPDLVGLPGAVSRGDGFRHLEGLLHGVGNDRRGGLDAIPRTLATQVRTHLDELADRGGD